jgi:nitrate/TMAO reductase-like tetraheme cytochrome c subunit
MDMEIIDSRHVTPDRFSIEKVRVDYDWSEGAPAYVCASLIVSLKPEGYLRSRFVEGVSYETKKHGARQLTIRAHELKQMMEAFSNEVDLCHQLLAENGLMPKLAEARREALVNKQPSTNQVETTSG